MFIHTTIIICMCVVVNQGLRFVPNPDVYLSTRRVLHKYGYKYETHEVVTEDGYIITIYRIPGALNSTVPNKHPVLVVPGTCGCSENFIVSGPNNGIAYFLVNRGFDVWLANTRGNRHARRHKSLNPDDKEFWDFGWHEVAVYDTPALIDYVLNATRKSDLIYIGHSQGVTSFLAFAAEKVEYNKKIRLSVQMAPSCFLKDTKNFVKMLGKHAALIQDLTDAIHLHEFLPKKWNDLLNSLLIIICSEMTIVVDICRTVVYSGQYSTEMDEQTLQMIYKTSPAGCSTKELIHYFQIVYSGYFRQYDYGRRLNLKRYGKKTPPNYNLTNIDSPIALFYALSDPIVPVKGVHKLIASLPKLVMAYEVPNEDFNHVDFIFGKNAASLVYEPMFHLLKKYMFE